MAKKANKDSKVVEGGNAAKVDIVEQTNEARGIDSDAKGGDDSGKVVEAAKPIYTPEMKVRDAQIKARQEHLAAHGATDNVAQSGLKKVEQVNKGKQYKGLLTVTSVHGQTHEKISANIDVPTASGEDYVKYAFLQHHPMAMVDDTFTIDETNTDDPNLRSRYE